MCVRAPACGVVLDVATAHGLVCVWCGSGVRVLADISSGGGASLQLSVDNLKEIAASSRDAAALMFVWRCCLAVAGVRSSAANCTDRDMCFSGRYCRAYACLIPAKTSLA